MCGTHVFDAKNNCAMLAPVESLAQENNETSAGNRSFRINVEGNSSLRVSGNFMRRRVQVMEVLTEKIVAEVVVCDLAATTILIFLCRFEAGVMTPVVVQDIQRSVPHMVAGLPTSM